MGATPGLGVPPIDWQAWCAQLACCVEALIERWDGDTRLLSQMTLADYKDALAHATRPAASRRAHGGRSRNDELWEQRLHKAKERT